MLARILLAGLLASTMMLAQGKKGGGGSKGPDMGGASFNTVSRLDRITEILKLNKDQRKDLKATFDDAQKDATPVRDELAKSRLAIGEAVAGGKTPDDIAKVCAVEAQAESQMLEIELRAFTKVALALDADQKQRAAGLFQMMRGMFSGKNWNELQ
jgi:hypothetical protein